MKYTFQMTGSTPLLMHRDDVMAADDVKAWREANKDKQKGATGDDRFPANLWMTYAYHHQGMFAVESRCLQKMLSEGGAKVPVGKGKETYKKQAVACIFWTADAFTLTVNGKPISFAAIKAALDGIDCEFRRHVAAAEAAGFQLDVRRASVGQSKHVRVRPRFDEWAVTGSFEVTDDEVLTPAVVATLWDVAGSRIGIGDWRPSNKSPGRFGMFTAKVSSVK